MNQADNFTSELLIKAGVKKGSKVLDIGCGRGDVSLLAADLVGSEGNVVGVDIDSGSIDVARKKINDLTISNVSFYTTDASKVSETIGKFDVIVGRRVLMYQIKPVEFIRNLQKCLKKNGMIAFQEHDMEMVPSNTQPMPLHCKVQKWLRHTISYEGADTSIGFNLYDIFTKAGFKVKEMKAEPIIQTPIEPYNVAAIVEAILPRILASNAATKDEIEIETLEARLSEERSKSNAIYIGDVKFGIWAEF